MKYLMQTVTRICYRKGLKIYFWLFRSSLCLFFGPFRLLSHFGVLREPLDYLFQTNIKEIIAKELDKCISPIPVRHNPPPRLTAFDLGAREGPVEVIEKNRTLFDRIILCEGEPQEAARLRAEGYEVIDKFIGREVGRGKFYHIESNPGASSLKKPVTKFMELYGGKDYYLEHLKYQETDIEVTDLPTELEKLGCYQVDLLKLDIQGCEHEVLSKMLAKSILPLIIHCEVMQVPFYFDTRYGCEIDSLLLNAHYICIRRSDEHFRGGMPIWCDQLYIPNPLQKEGYKIIENRVEDFLLLSKMYRFETLAARLLELS